MPIRYQLRKQLAALRADPFRKMRRHRHRGEAGLRAEYEELAVSRQAETFGLYRILGNDLPPRHTAGQSESNLRFILEHEEPLAQCEKRWIVNRIQDPAREQAIIDLLERFGQPYERIPFVAEEYRAIGPDHSCLPHADYLDGAACRRLTEDQRLRLTLALSRLKTNYVMNVNGARNHALQHGKQVFKWILPLDGACFFTAKAWDEFSQAVMQRPWFRYFLMPMCRVEDNRALLDPQFYAAPVDEPQIAFRSDSREVFDPDFTYGRRDKLELFWRLDVPGGWQALRDDPWDLRRNRVSPEAGEFSTAGWVCRLGSGQAPARRGTGVVSDRFRKRQIAILNMIEQTDSGLFAE